MPCDGVPARRLATEFELMLDHAEEEEEASPATAVTPNFPVLMELPRLTFFHSDDEDEDFNSQGVRT
ncbi:hypothetical protein Pmar_PMAR023767 [Perkinsus marinus ATCC 50983]|uniref:Uncharacterized protein n=1 Tax=Perkinsus marinus (strain ATCC 50983 / TXsc) TaxID=423536 RepID=C5KCH5_PERM5|nr:hypothetical protein Pmar_PMAR023767 [Perkinsus marinus ATCC 50983]EER17837.1 hypothetical protein Pmar_PMAR023767 [Perkinsus marinus ATCC 50983]|eukprot:XP_002786041.1 hypothetical protein Pmar_PMAR023767 [Perkinsus marinus ATCC 50983]